MRSGPNERNKIGEDLKSSGQTNDNFVNTCEIKESSSRARTIRFAQRFQLPLITRARWKRRRIDCDFNVEKWNYTSIWSRDTAYPFETVRANACTRTQYHRGFKERTTGAVPDWTIRVEINAKRARCTRGPFVADATRSRLLGRCGFRGPFLIKLIDPVDFTPAALKRILPRITSDRDERSFLSCEICLSRCALK